MSIYNDIDSEKIVIGMLLNGVLLPEELLINENCMSYKPNKAIFKSLLDFIENNDTTFGYLESIKDASVREYCESIMMYDYGNSDIAQESLITLYKKRQTFDGLQNAIKELRDKPADQVMSDLTDRIDKIDALSGEFDYVSLQESAYMTLDELYEISEGNDRGMVKTGIGTLDAIIGGFRKTELSVVGATTSHGKTSFILSCALNQMKHGHRVGLVSLETSHTRLTSQLAAMESRNHGKQASLHRIDTGKGTKEDFESMTNAVTWMASNMQCFILDKTDIRLADMKKTIRRWVRKEKVDIIYIDYIQLMEGDDGAKNREREVASISRALKSLAMELNIPIVAISQLNDEPDEKNTPRSRHLRESKAISHDANKIILVWRPYMYNMDCGEPNTVAKFLVDKNRGGIIKGGTIFFDEEIAQFRDADSYLYQSSKEKYYEESSPF